MKKIVDAKNSVQVIDIAEEINPGEAFVLRVKYKKSLFRTAVKELTIACHLKNHYKRLEIFENDKLVDSFTSSRQLYNHLNIKISSIVEYELTQITEMKELVKLIEIVKKL